MRDDQKGFVSIVAAVIMLLIITVVMRETVVKAYKIPAGSMWPTLKIGDHILVSKLAYGMRIPFSNDFLVRLYNPGRGDVIVFKFPEDRSKDFVKRVVRTGGVVVEVKNKEIWVKCEKAQAIGRA